MDIKKKAEQYRQKYGLLAKGGVVVFFNGEVNGWVDRLRDPQHWQAGALAIDEDGHQFVAIGGDYQSGARAWVVNDAN